MTGEDVRNLQKYLNANGFIISKTRVGSSGKESTLFGMMTYKALQKFQKSVGLPATGFFGPMTRAYINKQ
jgi:peptidoglycan hydrolase-like protein with peptidoglycan-binding domain